MNFLTDFVVTGRANAGRVARMANSHSFRDAAVFGRGLGPEELAELDAILAGGPRDPQFLKGPESLLLHAGPGECDGPLCPGKERWVYEVPPALVRRLAAMGPKQLADVAAAWYAVVGDGGYLWDDDEIEDLLAKIAGLCRLAVDRGEPLMLWVCRW
jgi:hypothetical protein